MMALQQAQTLSAVHYFPDPANRSAADNYNNRALYFVFPDRQIVYTGTRREDRVSTQEAAAAVITAICDAESLSLHNAVLLKNRTFFDLQTHRGYPDLQPGVGRLLRVTWMASHGIVRIGGFELIPLRNPLAVKVIKVFYRFVGSMRI